MPRERDIAESEWAQVVCCSFERERGGAGRGGRENGRDEIAKDAGPCWLLRTCRLRFEVEVERASERGPPICDVGDVDAARAIVELREDLTE